MHFVAHNFSQFVLGETKRVGGLRLYESTLNALKRAQELCDRHGIELTFIIAPSYPWDDYRLYSTGDWNLVRDLYAHVATLPRVYAFAQFNDLTGEPVSPSMQYWYDPFHFSRAMGELMQRSLADAAVDAPSDFMLAITPDTVEHALAVRLAGMQDWIARNQDHVRLFDAIRVAAANDGATTGVLDFAGEEMRLSNERYLIAPGFTGVVETVARNADHFVLSGWAADLANGRPAEAVVATIGERVVTKWFPGTIRVDNEAIYGRGIRPSNFVMRVNGVLPADASLLRVFALMKDGRAVQLFSTNPLVAGSFVSLPVIGEVNGETLSIDGSDYAIVERMAGSLEMATAAYPGFVVRGWAADRKANRPVSALVAAVGSTLVARSEPTVIRPDIEAGIAGGARPAGFVIAVPPGPHQEQSGYSL
ncbi:MAG: hypothetical protein ACXWUW_03710 [Rhodoplanes sp.]